MTASGNSFTEEYFKQLVHGPLFKPKEEMKYEVARLASFKDWPNWSEIQTSRLAKAGFFYSGIQDETICFSCHGHINRWEKRDNPNVEHRKFFPNCSYLKEQDTCKKRDNPNVEYRKSNTCNVPLNRTDTENNSLKDILNTPVTIADESVEVVRSTNKKYETFRLATFEQGWPEGICVSPMSLAKAGFYYTGSNDRVKCAFCNSVLHTWQDGDEPMLEHGRLCFNCPFITNPSAVGNVPLEEESPKTNKEVHQMNSVVKDQQDVIIDNQIEINELIEDLQIEPNENLLAEAEDVTSTQIPDPSQMFITVIGNAHVSIV